VTVKLARLAMVVLTCFVAGACGISLHPPASWLAHHAETAEVVPPDPVKPRPNPKLPAVKTGPLILAPRQTVVSLTFDDGRASNTLGAKLLTEHDLAGTFFLNSGNIGKPGYLTLAQVDQMAAQGQEIAGHTVTHPNLDQLSDDEIARQVCGDRQNWLAWGFPVRNFAYPFGYTTEEAAKIVHDCGYNSARTLADVSLDDPPSIPCQMCDLVEKVPPTDPYDTKAPTEVRDNWGLGELQTQVTVTSANGGGWLQLTFHGLCPTDCSDITTKQNDFNQFLDWLVDQQNQGNLIVRTVGDVIGGPVQPPVKGPPPTTAVVNGKLEEQQHGVPSCFQRASYGNNKPEFSRVPSENGLAERLVMHDYADGHAELVPMLDLGECALAVTAGHTYTISASYTSTAPTSFVVYYRLSRGRWVYAVTSPRFEPATAFTPAHWTLPPIPKEVTAISFGLALTSNGTLVTDNYAISPGGGA
jgi:peptidoglycan/xylan/chitin deacetylase (PgdA/CDA1 family)